MEAALEAIAAKAAAKFTKTAPLPDWQGSSI
jgi:hypothetical protein